MKRRTAIKASLLASATAQCFAGEVLSGGPNARQGAAQEAEQPEMSSETAHRFAKPIFIATWSFGKAACERSREVLNSGGSLLDAVERGINVTELDESNSSVGYGGLPNANGVVQLDASFMDGSNQKAGAVAALEGYPNPISVARRVMETTKHVMLAGADAAEFAKKNGFAERDMLTDSARMAWEKWKAKQAQGTAEPVDTHDTIALLGVGADGHVVGGCSTSGLAFKLPGRVGDSPIIGSGMYVDGTIGAAGATGVGENILRYCGSFLIVEFMRQGMEPSQACEAAIRRISEGEKRPPAELSVNFVAISRAGVVGAAGTDHGFRAAIVDRTRSEIVRPLLVK